MFFFALLVMLQTPFEKPWGNYLLEKIVETSAPPDVSWLPQTIGWKFIALGVIILLAKKCYQGYQSYKNNAYRREALAWLKHYQATKNNKDYHKLPALLRKTALLAFKRNEITLLNGKHWELWLDQQCSKTNFHQLCPDLLYQLAYMPKTQTQHDKAQYQVLIAQITLWIKYHRGANV